ncbi:MAG: hypothetical protein II796_03285 [Oscillospiraceae bacterium]|nr:hypothetical protein [Oscillospiraceae bacterium]
MSRKKTFKFISLFCFFICLFFSFLAIKKNYNILIVLFNSESVTAEDFKYINKYCNKFNYRLIDVKDCEDAVDVYSLIKTKYSHFYNKIKGVQIFGTKEDVPAFKCKFSCKMLDSDEVNDYYGTFYSDFCYSNFVADAEDLKDPIKIYYIEKNKTKFSFVPKWQVARVLLTRGQIAKYIKKHEDFYSKYNPNELKTSVFSCTVLDEPKTPDDMCYFMKEKLDNEFKLLKTKYSLYGNKLGEFPIKYAEDGDFTAANIVRENKQEPQNFMISTHGFKQQIVQSIKWPDEEKDHMYKFLSVNNINKKLKHNYYTLNTWCCYLAQGLDQNTIISKAMRGKCIDAIAATNILSNNGSNNTASALELENNNPFFFHYEFYKNLAQGNTRSQSFFNAKKAYAKTIVHHKDLGNYQYNLHNILSLHYFGLIA